MGRDITEILLTPLDWVTRPIVKRMMRKMHTYQEIASDVLVTTEWVEYTAVEPMKFERMFQEVYLALKDCQRHIEKEGLIFPDGNVANPEVQLVDQFGGKHQLKGGSYHVMPVGRDSDLMEVSRAGFSARVPQDREYRSVLIRSDKPFRCERIVWHNYKLK